MAAYLQPGTLAEALDMLVQQPLTILAGGTDVYPAMTGRALWGRAEHADILDISRLAGLRDIRREGADWRFGALASWTAVAAAALPAQFAGLQQAARQVGGVQIQNRGTLGGNICNASPAADGVPPLLSLDARVELRSNAGMRVLPLASFLDGYRHTVRRPDELVTAILVADGPGLGSFQKLGARSYLVISIAMVAAVLEISPEGTILAARIAVGSCSPVAMRLPGLERDLAGIPVRGAAQRIDATHVAGLVPIDDVRASGAYRRHAVLVMLKDALRACAGRFERKAA